jgi:diacylglycerol O-acyltransferase / wax synthase
MTRLSALDAMFLLLESEPRPMHAGVLMVFEPPAGEDPAAHLDRVLEAFMGTVPVAPFDRHPELNPTRLPGWRTDPVDLHQHLRRIQLPAPGSTTQLMELISDLYVGVLDRSLPLWACRVIEGLEDGGFAVFLKAHHALGDGISGARILFGSLSDSPEDAAIAPVWAPQPDKPRPRRQKKGPGLSDILGSLRREVGGAAVLAERALTFIPRTVGLLGGDTATPFTAPRIRSAAARSTSARSFAIFELSLAAVREVAKAAGGTVNDVVLAVCDDALRRYLVEAGEPVDRRLLASMAVSTRAEGDESTSNAAGLVQVRLGSPAAGPHERLAQIVVSTKAAKARIRRMSPGALQLQSIGLAGAAELRERLPVGRGLVPQAANLLVSNIPGGPPEPRYLGGAKLAGMYALPILPPAHALNITLASYAGSLCFGIAADRSVIADTPRIAEQAIEAFAALSETPVHQPAPA